MRLLRRRSSRLEERRRLPLEPLAPRHPCVVAELHELMAAACSALETVAERWTDMALSVRAMTDAHNSAADAEQAAEGERKRLADTRAAVAAALSVAVADAAAAAAAAAAGQLPDDDDDDEGGWNTDMEGDDIENDEVEVDDRTQSSRTTDATRSTPARRRGSAWKRRATGIRSGDRRKEKVA